MLSFGDGGREGDGDSVRKEQAGTTYLGLSLACRARCLVPVLARPFVSLRDPSHLFDTRVIHLLIEAHYNSVYLPLGVCEA